MSNNRTTNGSNSIPMTTAVGSSPLLQSSAPSNAGQHHPHHNPQGINLNVNSLLSNSCIHTRTAASAAAAATASNSLHLDPADQVLSASGHLMEEASHTPYFMNRDGCMETSASATGSDAIQAAV